MNPIGMKRISKPPNGVILNELIGIWCLQGVYLGTLVFGKSVLKGSQSDLFVRTVADADWPAVFLPSVASVCVFLALNVRLS